MFRTFIVSFLTITSCAHFQRTSLSSLPSPHKGQVIVGPKYYLDVVTTRHKVKIYPLHLVQGSKDLLGLPLQDFTIKVTSPEAEVLLAPKKDHFEGRLRLDESREQQLSIDVTYQETQKTFKLPVEFLR